MGPKKKLKKDFQKIFEEEHVDSGELQENIDEQKEKLVTQLQESFHPPTAGSLLDRFIRTCDYFVPHYSKADLLASKYQKLYRRASKAIYALAACAVMIVSAQYIFELPVYIIHGEIASMLIILAIIGYGSKRIGWHRRWLDYRLLAERLRFGIFTAFLAGRSGDDAKEHWHRQWVEDESCVCLYHTIWSKRPFQESVDTESLDPMKNFINMSWLDDQRKYHENKSRSELRKHDFLSWTGAVFFALTLLAASLHVFHVGNDFMGKIWTFLAIAFPVSGAGFSALRGQFELKKVAARSAMMTKCLASFQERLNEIKDLMDLRELVIEAEALMLQENADWHVTMRFHELEPPA